MKLKLILSFLPDLTREYSFNVLRAIEFSRTMVEFQFFLFSIEYYAEMLSFFENIYYCVVMEVLFYE